ncbi:MgtC/SapB family protein [bacterium]|nr:MgtC/SapB family protein [bacterium]
MSCTGMPTSELITRLVVAVALAGALGLEREVRQKHAGLRTHALVGLGAALIVEVGAYGFSDVLVAGKVVVDPSRVAAQVVSGIGFIGAGLIFVRQEYVRGLTTAASIWLTAAVGLAAGAGLWEIALAATILGLAVVEGLELFERLFLHDDGPPATLRVIFVDGDPTAFDSIVAVCGAGNAGIGDVRLHRRDGDPPTVAARIQVRGLDRSAALANRLLAVSGVVEVAIEGGESSRA